VALHSIANLQEGDMQPDLSQYYGSLTTGHTYFLEAEIGIVWAKVGSVTFSRLTPASFSFTGSYDINVGVTHIKGDVNMSLDVTGENVGTLSFNGQKGSCRFQRDGDNLNILFGTKTYKIMWWKSGIWIGGDVPTVTALWIGE
jgi:hypothetical protein